MCYHQITYAKISFKVFFPPTYIRNVWHYKKARADLIKRSIKLFYCEKAFQNHSFNEKMSHRRTPRFYIHEEFVRYWRKKKFKIFKCKIENKEFLF